MSLGRTHIVDGSVFGGWVNSNETPKNALALIVFLCGGLGPLYLTSSVENTSKVRK